MSTKLAWIDEKARKEPKLVFTSLYHHITDVDNLRACYDSLNGDRAVGVDGVTKEEYGLQLEDNLKELSDRLKRMGYRPQPKRRTYISKASSKKKRPLGISCFEDKIVEESVKRTLEPIYEAVFEGSSYGYRPGRSQHDCLDVLGRTIQQKRVNHVVEADIRSFFDKVDHEWMMKFLEHRIGDQRVLRLIRRMLKGGIMEDGLTRASEAGTPQGSILSPLLSNIYLHYVLDLWFRLRIRKSSRGEAYYFRFADDFLACFQYEDDARNFLESLRDRLKGFGLELAEDKTKIIRFGRFARENASKRGKKPGEFTFLGFTHYCGKTKEGYFKVKRRTSRKKFRQSLREFSEWARRSRNVLRKGEMVRMARVRILGHLNYYDITDNMGMCKDFIHFATRILFKWINRKSQRKSYVWPAFKQVLSWSKWPVPCVRIVLNPCRNTHLSSNGYSKSRMYGKSACPVL
jgi:group II intron reverse transcriptase/maturase